MPLVSHHLQPGVMEHTRIQLPGFGLPVNCYQQHGDPYAFPSSLNQSDMDNDRTV